MPIQHSNTTLNHLMLCSPVISGSACASITKHIPSAMCALTSATRCGSGECGHLLQLLTEVVERDAVNLRTLNACTGTA